MSGGEHRDVRLTACADCFRCKGAGIYTDRTYYGELRIGGPPQVYRVELKLCGCVRTKESEES